MPKGKRWKTFQTVPDGSKAAICGAVGGRECATGTRRHRVIDTHTMAVRYKAVVLQKGRIGCSKHQALVMRMTRNHRPLVDGRMKDLRRWRTEEMAAVGDGTDAQLHHHEGEGTNYLCRLVRAEQGCAAQQRKR
eukprot:6481453-Prymnesium_polylepis.2